MVTCRLAVVLAFMAPGAIVFSRCSTTTPAAIVDAGPDVTMVDVASEDVVDSEEAEAAPVRREGGAAGCSSFDASVAFDGGDAGLFQAFTRIATAAYLEAAAIGDVTGDGRPDVVVTTSYLADGTLTNDSAVLVFAQQSDGSLASPVRYPTGGTFPQYEANSIAVGDFNGDGRTDVAVPYIGGVGVFYQTGEGTLAPIQVALFPTATFQTPRLIVAGDFNTDGRTDIAGVGTGPPDLGVYLQDDAGALMAPVGYTVDDAAGLAPGDLDGDGRTDLVLSNFQGYTPPGLEILYQETDGSMGTLAPYWYPAKEVTEAFAVGDLNSDCLDDVAANAMGSTSMQLYMYPQYDGNLASPALYPVPETFGAMKVADVNGDRRLDLVALWNGYPGVSVYVQYTNGTLLVPINLPFAIIENPSAQALVIGDVNGDGQPDIVAADHYTAGLDVMLHTPP
jgi:hypothetical protein